jgi:hypothetical protein
MSTSPVISPLAMFAKSVTSPTKRIEGSGGTRVAVLYILLQSSGVTCCPITPVEAQQNFKARDSLQTTSTHARGASQ